jgi:class 3 adenylate cyclase
VSIVGDAANLAFRLSGLAGRDSRAPVIVTDVIHDEVADRYRFGPPEKVDTKGRSGQETIYELLGPI